MNTACECFELELYQFDGKWDERNMKDVGEETENLKFKANTSDMT